MPAPSLAIRRQSAAQLARELGVSRQAIHDLVARRVLSKDADGLIDVEMAKIALLNRVQPSSKTAQALAQAAQAAQASIAMESEDQGASKGQNSFYAAKTQREKAEARMAEMKLGEMTGQLLKRDTTERAVYDAFRSLRDHAFAAPQRAAPRLVGLADVRQIEFTIAEELRRAFDGWEAKMAERMGSKQVPDASQEPAAA